MAGNLGGGDDNGGMITEMNVVPLVDVILVVLVIFMLTANLIARPSIPVELPEASTGDTGGEPTTVAITVTKDGGMYLNGAPTDEAGLKAFVPDVVKNDPKAQAIIAADKEVPHGKVIRVIDLIRQLGLYKFALNVDPGADAK